MISRITLENVSKQFGSKVAVDRVTFAIPGGFVFGLLGPNGAGKTTVIRMLMDILRPDDGVILYDGHELTAAHKDRITYLPEERGLYRKEKVLDLLEYFAVLKGVSRAAARRRAREYLDRLEMADVADKKVEELSKGNQQKIQIAATLVSDPEVIILDEPFAGLDPLNVRLTKRLLAGEKSRGKTILLSTHQMNQVEELCDSLVMIHHGRKVLEGPLKEVLQRYAEPALILECPSLDGEIPEIERIEDEEGFWKVFPAPGVTPAGLLKALLERGVAIESFQRAATPLEEIFVKVVEASRKEAVRA